MHYDPHIPATRWQHPHPKSGALDSPRVISVQIDKIRLARLMIFLSLVAFWGLVGMAIF